MTCVQLNIIACSSSPSAYILGYFTPLHITRRCRRGYAGVQLQLKHNAGAPCASSFHHIDGQVLQDASRERD
jgi:hypothetical protein